MSSDAPEFHTKPSTPLSPLPFHPPEPSNITVLRYQTDPVFNMTSTHLDPVSSAQDASLAPQEKVADVEDLTDMAMDTPDDSSFSDAYKEEDTSQDVRLQSAIPKPDEDDDYAREFESEVEEDNNKQAETNTEAEKESTSSILPAGDSIVSTAPEPTHADVPNDSSSSFTPSPSASIPPSTSTEERQGVTENTSTSKPVENMPSQAPNPSYDDIANGEIDIQQLLDNITATAELKASNSAGTTPVGPAPASASFPPASSGLPVHASLPPRPAGLPNIPPQQAFTTQDSTRKYQTGPPSLPPPSMNPYGPPGLQGVIVAAGAPGTSTDARHGLPPPPSASFHSAPAMTTVPPLTHVPFQQISHVPTHDRPRASVELVDGDSGEVQWGPATQKLYDEFLADERSYVAEGLWDRFPTGSRLFIGKQCGNIPQ